MLYVLAAELPFINIPGVYLSPSSKWLHQIDISWTTGLAVGGLLYLALSRSLDLQAEAVLIAKNNSDFNKNGVVR